MIKAQYNNGNTYAVIYTNGTKVRTFDGEAVPEFPESIDVKITDYCDMGCAYCHESSTVGGKHGDLEELKKVLAGFPKGIELAIGGGNPLSHPNLTGFLNWADDNGFICNLTVNQGHLEAYFDTLVKLISLELITGIGISITNSNFGYVKSMIALSNNIVFHVIAGVSTVKMVNKLHALSVEQRKPFKVLILGYKNFGLGVEYNKRFTNIVSNNIAEYYSRLGEILPLGTISFDNLALEQLNVKRFLSNKDWRGLYMGDDFTFSMYIDAVKKQFAPTSRSYIRKNWSDISLFDFFQNNGKIP